MYVDDRVGVMGKARKGQRVTHRGSGEEGVVVSIVRNTIRVVFRDGTESTGYTSSYYKTPGGCVAVPFLTIMGALGGGAAYLVNQIYL